MDSPGLAPGSPACDASVFLLDDEPILSPKVHASVLSARHAPKDLNPDQLGWNQSCYRYTRDTHLSNSGSRETRTHKSRSRPPVFKTGSSSGRMASVRHKAAGVGIEPTASWFRARRHYQQQLPRNVWLIKTANAHRGSQHSVRESHPICELQRLTPRLRAGESALRESNLPRQLGRLVPLPIGQGHML